MNFVGTVVSATQNELPLWGIPQCQQAATLASID